MWILIVYLLSTPISLTVPFENPDDPIEFSRREVCEAARGILETKLHDDFPQIKFRLKCKHLRDDYQQDA